MTDIREAAARAAREWATKGEATGDRWATGENCYIDGYLAGYAAAKAEAAKELDAVWDATDNGPCGKTLDGPCPGIEGDSGCGWCENYKPNGGSHD